MYLFRDLFFFLNIFLFSCFQAAIQWKESAHASQVGRDCTVMSHVLTVFTVTIASNPVSA